ncbi:MAG: hypothetical protein II727_05020, partial [Oscillospiraceae bacterium]|nr:hypothetical protein [Oscillospiraceae bacterium]
YKLTIPNLSAHRLGEMFTINGKVISGGEEKSTFQVQVSALSYVRSILNKNETDEETVLWKRTVAAFYRYYDAAIHY